MRLLEFNDTPLLFKDALAVLHDRYQLQRVGGTERVYTVGNELAVAFIVGNGPGGVGLSWRKGDALLSTMYIWDHFDATKSPSMMVNFPAGSTMADLQSFIANPHMGQISEDAAPAAEPLQTPANDPASQEEPEAHTKLYIVAKNAAGVFFEVPGMAATAARLTRAYNAQKGADGKSMEEQYAELEHKVRLVASGDTASIKALIITGAPSAGKTFNVMETIKAMGLKEGKDYTVKKGSVTDVAVYKTFIKNQDMLTIFDDCDSVFKTTDGRNMLKAALDTGAVRLITRDNADSLDTESMEPEDRIRFMEAMSRILRGVASEDDLDHFERYANTDKKGNPKPKRQRPEVTPDDGFWILGVPEPEAKPVGLTGSSLERMHELQKYFSDHLPNSFEFRGRVIFISNVSNEVWLKDQHLNAILTRSFSQQMNFSDEEMLDFIEKIQMNIPAPKSVTPEMRSEVLAELRHLFESGRLTQAINFRLVQECFDLRLTTAWKSMMSAM